MGEDNCPIHFKILNSLGEKVGVIDTPNIPEIHLTGEEINTPMFQMDEGEITISMQIENGEEFQRKLGIEPRWDEYVQFLKKCVLRRLATKPRLVEKKFTHPMVGEVSVIHQECPTCGKILGSYIKKPFPYDKKKEIRALFCDMCGQCIDWKEEEHG